MITHLSWWHRQTHAQQVFVLFGEGSVVAVDTPSLSAVLLRFDDAAFLAFASSLFPSEIIRHSVSGNGIRWTGKILRFGRDDVVDDLIFSSAGDAVCEATAVGLELGNSVKGELSAIVFDGESTVGVNGGKECVQDDGVWSMSSIDKEDPDATPLFMEGVNNEGLDAHDLMTRP